MAEKISDLRLCKRIFFSDEDNIEGAVIISKIDNQEIPIKFLNLSEGGVSFQVERSNCQNISWDQIVTFKVERTTKLAFLDNIKVKVKYVLDYDIVRQVTFGCQFIELPNVVSNEIRKIVADQFKQKENIF